MLDQARIRLDAILHVLALRERWIAAPAAELQQFRSQGETIALRGPQGIFKPKELTEPLTVLSSLSSSYNDEPIEGDRIRYDFLPVSHEHDNVGLKRAGEFRLPLIYLLQVKENPNAEYEIFAPVYVVGWDDDTRQFLLDLSGRAPDVAVSQLPLIRGGLQLPLLVSGKSAVDVVREIPPGYLDGSALRRINHAHFRREVLRAYRDRCAVCAIRVRPLLDAACVDQAGDGVAAHQVCEGIALCVMHHRAFVVGILSFDEDYIVHVRLPTKTRPTDGERQLLLAYDGKRLTLPKDREKWPRLRPEAPARP